MIVHNKHFINGVWRFALDTAHTVVHDSATEEVIATVSHGNPSEIDAAVKSAKIALPLWSSTSIARRTSFIRAIADELEARLEVMVNGIAAEVGMPLKLTRRIQVEAPISAWRATAEIAADALADIPLRHSVITKEPVGVVGAITPWNYPLHQITGKLAAALAAGCCVVLKPSELAPSASQALGEAIAAANLPNGVVNIVFGDKNAGEALVKHADVNLVSFTGSTAVGKHIASIAGQALKRISLELGGKSAGIALADADQAVVIKHVLASCFLNSGQTCSAITRLLVPQQQYEHYRAQLQTAVNALKVGDPRDGKTRIGPLVSAEHRRRVQSFITEAIDLGYDVINTQADISLPTQGFYVLPTIFGRVPINSRLAQEEVFGPVLTVQTYADEDEAIAIANGTAYGLAGAVWSASSESGERIARRIRAGQVDVNGAPFNAVAPFGGFGASGIGREGGTFGIEEFTEIRSIQLPEQVTAK
jgi:aldehyde dehydrogenase (NAD+)